MTPSVRTLLLLGAIFSTVFAAPQYKEQIEEGLEKRGDKTLEPPPLPSSALPPPTGLNLKVITVGVGTQNYTCNSTTGTYGSNVAVAKLYDATKYLSKNPDKVSTLSRDRLAEQNKHGDCADDADYSPHLKRIGSHYFANATPVLPDFDLYKLDLFIEARAVQRVPAPDTAKDVDWVFLRDSGSGQTKGLNAVYRVETAGGKPPATCSGNQQVFIPYATQYWFYN